MKTLEYKSQLEIKYNVDVLVLGGGPSGVAAAVKCARQRLKNKGDKHPRVMLIEQSGCLGGSSILAMVAEIMNFDDGENFLAGGFGREVHDTLFGECKYKREWQDVHPEELKRQYDKMITEAGVELLLYTKVVNAVCNTEGRVDYAIVSGPDGMYAINADYYIDCTGAASFCESAGAKSYYGDTNGTAMSATLCSQWCGVNFEQLRYQEKYLKEAYEEGILSQYDTALPGIKRMYPEYGVGGGNIGHCFGVDDRNAEDMTKATLKVRLILSEYEKYYRKYVAGCENVVLIQTATNLGIRESRRVECETMLTIDRFDSDIPFEDEIGRYSYPIDIHPMTADKAGMQNFFKNVSKEHTKGGSYSIPYSCLLPKGFSNLFVAGKCIGADHEMIASVRVIPGCYITGQATGIAAAVCCDNSCDNTAVDYNELRQRLIEAGAYLKN